MWVTGIDSPIGISWQKYLRQFILICFSLVNFCMGKSYSCLLFILATVVDDWLVVHTSESILCGWLGRLRRIEVTSEIFAKDF